MYRQALFIFHRDLRLYDNKGLLAAGDAARTVIPLFIIDEQQVTTDNRYLSLPALQFMIESLKDLDQELHAHGGKLYIAQGTPAVVIEQLLSYRSLTIDAVYQNDDYTPFAQQRTAAIHAVCKRFAVPLYTIHDALLNAPGTILTKQQRPYLKFTPFYHAAQRLPVARPASIPAATATSQVYYSASITGTYDTSVLDIRFPHLHRTLRVQGGRTAGNMLCAALPSLARYTQERDIPAYDRTTHLSAYLKFTIYSPRELYYLLKDDHHAPESLLRQLYWRDFFTAIAAYTPHIFSGAYYKKYDHIPWRDDQQMFERWKTGTTGFPFVDAGMRQLNETGWMHNRARLVTASFLTKDLHIDWRRGEAYFAQQLVDYDPAVNNGNWQWIASTGCDAQPFFRIFNPWLQQKRFDPQATYIKQWIPELRTVSTRTIHRWYEKGARPPHHPYPAPLIHHSTQAQRAIDLYKAISGS